MLAAHAISAPNDLPPGTCFRHSDSASGLLGCACGQGALVLEVIQLEGKRALPAGDVLRGYPALASAMLGG